MAVQSGLLNARKFGSEEKTLVVKSR